MAYRIVWSLAFCVLLLLFIKGSWREVGRTLRDRRALVLLAVASVAIAINWTTYV